MKLERRASLPVDREKKSPVRAEFLQRAPSPIQERSRRLELHPGLDGWHKANRRSRNATADCPQSYTEIRASSRTRARAPLSIFDIRLVRRRSFGGLK